MPASFATATHPGRVRPSNEDAFFARPPVFAVADGMGGAAAGEVASAMAAGALKDYRPGREAPEPQMERLLAGANGKIYRKAVSEPGYRGMGTTITAAVVDGGRVALAHVGDSRAYLWRGGRLSPLTEDHSLVGEMLRLGQLDPGEAETHPQRSIITRALGVDPEVEIDTLSLDWEKDDLFLLCSDGLHAMMPDEDIGAVLERSGDLEQLAGALVDEANSRGGRDNITVILFAPERVAGDETGGRHREAPEPRQRRRLSSTAGRITLATVVVIVALAGGGWLASRHVYYLGVEQDRVVIYQGLPLSVGPVDLYDTWRESGVDFGSLEPFEQERVLKGELRSQSEAERMLESYERRERMESPAGAATVTGTGGRS